MNREAENRLGAWETGTVRQQQGTVLERTSECEEEEEEEDDKLRAVDC